MTKTNLDKPGKKMTSPPKTSIHLGNFKDGPTNSPSPIKDEPRNNSPTDKHNFKLEAKTNNFDIRNNSVVNDH